MNRMPSPLSLAIVSAMSIGLSGCFGGSSSGSGTESDNDSDSTAVSGIAATGAPLSGAEVCLSTSNQNGCAATTTTDENGQYSFSDSALEGLEAPFAITVEGEDAGGDRAVLRSIAETKNDTTANVTPFSELVLSGALNKADLSDLDPSAALDQNLWNTQQAVRAILENAEVLSKLDIDADIDLVGDANFKADRTGLDRLLDLVDISIYETGTDGNAGILITDLGNRTQRLILESANGSLRLSDTGSDFSQALDATDADLPAIRQLFSDLGALLGEDAASTEFTPLVHEDYLELGMDRDEIINEMQNELFLFEDVKDLASSFSVNGCETVDEGIACQSKVMMLDADGNKLHPLDIGIIETQEGWKLWGDRMEDDLELQPYAMHQEDSAPELGIQFQLMSSLYSSARVSTTRPDSEEEVFTWTGGDNRIAMSASELSQVKEDDGHYKIELYESEDLSGAPDKTYTDIALDSLPFLGAPEAYANRFPELTDESREILNNLDSDADTATVTLDVHPTTRIQELIISVPTSGSCNYRLDIDAHNIDPTQTLNLRDSDIGCPDGSFEGTDASVLTVTVDDKGRFYFK